MNTREALTARRGALVLVCLLVLVTAPSAAQAHGAYSMEILVDGAPLREYAARGTSYVEALQGREYSIRLRNNTARRVAIALSVDGLNTIDARTTSAREGSKWILGPHETITLEGWQTSSSMARRFFFTTEENSYGSWLGRTRNLGLISAAVYRERRPETSPIWKEEREHGELRGDEKGSGLDSPSAAPERKRASAPEASDDFAATGIGRGVGHSVRHVQFDAEATPAAILELRYEYRDALVRLGVLPSPPARCEDSLARRERARGFEGMDFAPDPFPPSCP